MRLSLQSEIILQDLVSLSRRLRPLNCGVAELTSLVSQERILNACDYHLREKSVISRLPALRLAKMPALRPAKKRLYVPVTEMVVSRKDSEGPEMKDQRQVSWGSLDDYTSPQACWLLITDSWIL